MKFSPQCRTAVRTRSGTAPDLTGFRVIQEDEYDQHMDEDEDKPDHDDMLADVPNGYLWMH